MQKPLVHLVSRHSQEPTHVLCLPWWAKSLSFPYPLQQLGSTMVFCGSFLGCRINQPRFVACGTYIIGAGL